MLTLAALHFCAHADRVLPAALAPVLRERFAIGDAQLGLIHGTAFILPFTVATLIAGVWGPRFGAPRLTIVSVVAWTAAGVLFAVAQSYRDLLLARMALGIAQAGFAPAAAAVLSAAARPSVAVSAFTAGASAGRSGGLLIVGVMLTAATLGTTGGWEPWRVASLWLLAPNLVLIVLLIAAPLPRGALPSNRGAMVQVVRRQPLAVFAHLAGASAVILIVQAGGAWSSSIIARGFGLEAGAAATMTGASVLLGAPAGHLLAGQLFARHRGLAPGPVMAAGAAAAFCACLSLAVPSLPFALAGVILLNVAGGLAAAAGLIGLQPMVTPADRLPVNAAYFATVSLVGFGLGPLLTGVASDRLEGELAIALMLVIGIAAVVVVVAAVAGNGAWRQAVDAATGNSPAPGEVAR